MDLDKLNLIKLGYSLVLGSIFSTVSAASKITTRLMNCQMWVENNNLTLLALIRDTLYLQDNFECNIETLGVPSGTA